MKRYAEADHRSMNSWIEGVLGGEDMRRRCAAHAAWLAANPTVSQQALAFGEVNQQALADAGLPNIVQRR